MPGTLVVSSQVFPLLSFRTPCIILVACTAPKTYRAFNLLLKPDPVVVLIFGKSVYFLLVKNNV